jgi:hypothetical protein
MSVTIFYRILQRPDAAGLTYVPDDGYAAALKDQLVERGFQIVKIVPTPATASSGRVPSPPPDLADD